mmetsp:Transcript_14351/g.27327  ORF Transcript_14351/g.27327 Transcript_14351/m.27327 type:complete len:553 (+) Transcript_14351:77-1735(+)
MRTVPHKHKAAPTSTTTTTTITTMKKSPLPSTPDEIPSSDIRQHPLTSEELHDIRSLIGSAKKSSNNNASLAQQTQPLAGRRVMIPITSKAFFEGTLQPPTKNVLNISRNNAADVAMQEQIIMNVGGGKFEEMTRAKARDFLEKQQRLSETKEKKKKKAVKSSLKSKKATSKVTTRNDDAPTPSTADEREQERQPSLLPLIEIRETHDPNGRILNSEVVNMSNTMQRLGNSMKNVNDKSGDNKNDDDDDGDGKELGEMLARTLKSAQEDIITLDTKKLISFADAEEEKTPEKHAASANKTRGTRTKEAPISEADYDALCTRLEELERMEEEDGEEKRSSVESSKRLQSGGWGKGFLNGGSTKKKGGKQKQQQQQQLGGGTKERFGAKGAYGNVKERTPATMGKVSESTAAAAAAATAIQEIESDSIDDSIPSDNNNASSRVSFSGSNQIKEIPRIGQSKVPPRPTTTTTAARGRPSRASFDSFRPTSTNGVDVPEVADPFGQVSQPFEEKVLRGVVKERGGSSAAKSSGSGGGDAGGTKRLSRFAQQRLQRG